MVVQNASHKAPSSFRECREDCVSYMCLAKLRTENITAHSACDLRCYSMKDPKMQESSIDACAVYNLQLTGNTRAGQDALAVGIAFKDYFNSQSWRAVNWQESAYFGQAN